MEIVPIGLKEDTYPQVSDRTLADTRAKYGEDFFLFVGVLRYYKCLHILLDALPGAPYRVVIAGSGPRRKPFGAGRAAGPWITSTLPATCPTRKRSRC